MQLKHLESWTLRCWIVQYEHDSWGYWNGQETSGQEGMSVTGLAEQICHIGYLQQQVKSTPHVNLINHLLKLQTQNNGRGTKLSL